MPRLSSIRKPLLMTMAVLFSAVVISYSVAWVLWANREIPVELGFDDEFIPAENAELVKSVVPGSPAEKAGLGPGDLILAINGKRIDNPNAQLDYWARHRPGDTVDLTVQHPNGIAPVFLQGIFRVSREASAESGLTRNVALHITNSYPFVFLVVGFTVLFLRLDDPNAWLLALLFACFIGVPGFRTYGGLGPHLRAFTLAYRAFFDGLVGALFFYFFAVFPVRSAIDRRVPGLKWIGVAIGTLVGLSGLTIGAPRLPAALGRHLGHHAALPVLIYEYGFVALGFVCLLWTGTRPGTADTRRKLRIILWGTLVGVGPVTINYAMNDFLGWSTSFWLSVVLVLLLFLFPLSFAYAVAKHRVLEIPVLLRRSARYLLVQRGFVVLLAIASVAVTLLFAISFARYLQAHTTVAVPAGILLGVGFGTVLLWTGTRVHDRVGNRIDRAFFRTAYDARMILADLAEKTRTVTDKPELAVLLDQHLRQALQPSGLAIYAETSAHRLTAAGNRFSPLPQVLSTTDLGLMELARTGRPLEISGSDRNPVPGAECLVPMLARDSRLIGLIALGPRLSEEPYSHEDKQLLASVASQAGMALESIGLGEKIAERIEVERRTAQEMDYAKQVQARLFPQKLPVLQTLEYAGGCTQARQVGGDYYDFLELHPGRMALVLADIAGKGISGALLMANLQANLRSQYAASMDDLPRLLGSVNRLFFENTSDSSYATLFFADYDDAGRRLRYVNCGHLPPLLLRADGTVDHLTATATVLGLFEPWECTVEERILQPGDIFALYTDGVTEAEEAGNRNVEFGEARLLELLRSGRKMAPVALLERIVQAVQEFSAGEQSDDITLVLARVRPAAT